MKRVVDTDDYEVRNPDRDRFDTVMENGDRKGGAAAPLKPKKSGG